MNIALSTGSLVLFFVSILGSLFVLFKQGQQKLKFSITIDEAKGPIITLLMISAAIGLRALLSTDQTIEGTILNIACFAGAFSLPFLLRQANFSYEAMALLLLVSGVLLIFLAGTSLSLFGLLSALAGLLVYKIIENLSLTSDSRFDDVIPACIWLTVISWASLTGRNSTNIANILLACLSISLLLKVIQPFCITGDKFFAKRIVLSIIGGLALLLVLTKVLLLPQLGLLAAFYGASIFFSSIFENISFDGHDIHQLSKCTKFLVLLGILTLAATRLTGDTGLIVMASASLLCTPTNPAVFAGFFWISRLLIQGFVSTYVSNVTGINLMHAYCSAAQYFGFLSILFIALTLYLNTKKWMTILAVLLLCILAPPALIYLIHEESSASFLIAANVAAIAITSFSTNIFKDNSILKQGNLLLLPLMMTISSLYSGALITIGNSGTASGRFHFVFYIAGALLIVYLCLLFRALRKRVVVS